MSIQDRLMRTMKCDNEFCPHFETPFSFWLLQGPQGLTPDPSTIFPDWVKPVRMVQTGDGRVFHYCSAVCSIKDAQAGKHEIPEPKKIEVPTNVEVDQAVANAKAADAMRTT